MNVNFITPISLVITRAKLDLEDTTEGVGTVEFQIDEQPVRLIVPTSSYTFDSPFSIGCRVKLNINYGNLGIDSSGILQSISFDSTEDKGNILFDTIYPNQDIFGDSNVNIETGIIRIEFTVPLSALSVV